jgi:signal transduction histidine kinase
MFVVLVVTALIAWAAYKISIRRKIQHALTLERVRTSERDRMREQISKDFHDELGHKLTKISLFSELSRRAIKKDPEESSAFLEKVTEASSSLSVNTRDFIWVLDPGKDTLYDVIVNLRDFAYDLYEKTGVDFRLQGMTESLERVRLSMDWRRHLTLIFKEALTNVLKHAHAKQVNLLVIANNGKIVITLQDNGKGFDTHVTDLNRNGLRNIRERTKRLGGNISIESRNEKGTMIRFEGDLILTDPTPSPSRLSWISAVKSWFI